MTVPAIHPESFPIQPEKREISKLGLMFAAIGIGAAACGWAMASLDNYYGRQRSLPRPIETGLVGEIKQDELQRSAVLFFPGFDYGNIKGTVERLAPYLGDDNVPIGYVDNNTGAFPVEKTVHDALEFIRTNNLEHVVMVGLSAGGMEATETAVACNQNGIKTDLVYFSSPHSYKDVYLGQRIPLWLASWWARTGINFGPVARFNYELMRALYEKGFRGEALRQAYDYTLDQHTPPNSSIFGRAGNIFAHRPERVYPQLNPETRAVDIYANRANGDGTIKNRQAVQRRAQYFGGRHHEIVVDGIGHMDIEGKFEVYGLALQQAIRWLGGTAVSSVISSPEIEPSVAVQIVTPAVSAA